LWDLPPELAELHDLAARLTDLKDRSQVNVLHDDEDVLSSARAGRFPPDGSLVDRVRVVLVEVAAFAPAWDIAGKVQRSLERRGAVDPQVEVFWTGEELPPYHRAALASAALAGSGRPCAGQVGSGNYGGTDREIMGLDPETCDLVDI
jgi:hypothetical protein